LRKIADFIERILGLIYASYRRFGFVELMNEIHRALKLEGVFYRQPQPFFIRQPVVIQGMSISSLRKLFHITLMI